MTNKPTIEILIKNCYKDIQHVKQVSKYSEMLFDTLNNKMFSYTEKEKKYLKVAALLHDIGYCIEKKSHHKHSMNMILENGLSEFDEKETQIIANIARYHRNSFPDETKHENYANLDEDSKVIVKKLSALLRIADGMDKPSKNLILDVKANISEETVDFYVKTIGYQPKLKMAIEKSNLFEFVFQKKVNFLIANK